VDTTGAITAIDCALGTYNPDPGQTGCTPAPPNTYVGSAGATSATPCPPATFNPDTGSTGIAACVTVTVGPVGDRSDFINTPVPALTASESNGITPVSWSATGLPVGLTIGPSSGTITGTPTTPCTCSVTLRSTDADGDVGSVSFTWTILAFGISTNSLPTATPGTSYGPVPLQAGGLGVSTTGYTTTLRWKKVTLPKGLTLSPSGDLAGTPKARSAAPGSVTVQVTETVTTLNGKKRVKNQMTALATIPFA
jgi:hypothetical protein